MRGQPYNPGQPDRLQNRLEIIEHADGRKRPWSDCPDAQTDSGFLFLDMV